MAKTSMRRGPKVKGMENLGKDPGRSVFMRVSKAVRDYILKRQKAGESADRTLRRLLGVGKKKTSQRNGK